MKRIGITNNPKFPIDEWTKKTITLWEMFNEPVDLNNDEIKFAQSIMDYLQLEVDNDEGLIEFVSRPQDMMYFIVQMKRILDIYSANTK